MPTSPTRLFHSNDDWLERNDGGHYAAAEDPDGMIEDVRALAVQEWQKS